MKCIRTNPSPSFATPSDEEVQKVVETSGLEKFSVGLIQDLANLAAGGSIALPSQFRQKVNNEVRTNVPLPDSDGEWKLQNGNYTKSRDVFIRDQTNEMMGYHARANSFLEQINLDQVPGETPLAQAINVSRVLARMPEVKSWTNSQGEERLHMFDCDTCGQKAIKRINKLFKKAIELDKDAADLLDPEKDHPSTLSDEDRITLTEDMAEGKDIIFEISQKLKTMRKLKTRKPRRFAPDVEGDNCQSRPISSMNELGRLVTSEWAVSPLYRKYRIMTRVARVKERTSSAIFKQLLFILVDVSGSMDSGQRIQKMSGVVMNRLQAVLDDQAELFVRMFDVRLHEECFHITKREEAQKLMSWLQRCKYDGKNTDIDLALEGAIENIDTLMKENPTLDRPEIAIVTDGDDQVATTVKDLSINVLHAFVVEGRNESLAQLAIKSGGVVLQDI